MSVLSREYLESFVCERFRNEAQYREGHIRILAPAPDTDVLGIHTPEMKKIAKQIAKSNSWESTLTEFANHKPLTGKRGLLHEERMIWGLVIDYVRTSHEERLALTDAFLPCIDNWAICDNFCCNSAWAKKADSQVLWHYIVKLLHSNKEWCMRVGIVFAMCHFLDDSNIDRTFAEIDVIGLREKGPYYVRMGVAWLLATALAKDADRTRHFVNRSSLPNDIVKLYVRKARESFRTRNVQAI